MDRDNHRPPFESSQAEQAQDETPPILVKDQEVGSPPRFRLIERIGSGGMGEVWKALDLQCKKDWPERDCLCALKFPPLDWMRDPGVKNNLKREANAAKRLDCPHTVKVYNWHEQRLGEERGSWVFIEMEYLRGKSFRQWLQKEWKEGLPFQRMVELIKPVAQALDCAHDQGLIHRDIKPANLFLLDNGEVRVLDFGIADEFRKTDATLGTNLRARSSGGTPGYMAPEASTHPPEPRQDVHALACVIYELLTGRPPFYITPETPRLPGLLPEKPKELTKAAWEVLKKGFAREREQRPATAGELVEALIKAMNQQHHHKWWMIALMVGSVAALGVSWWQGWIFDHEIARGSSADAGKEKKNEHHQKNNQDKSDDRPSEPSPQSEPHLPNKLVTLHDADDNIQKTEEIKLALTEDRKIHESIYTDQDEKEMAPGNGSTKTVEPVPLKIETNVDGVEIWIDGKKVGLNGGEYAFEPGAHKVELRKFGYRRIIYDLSLLPGQPHHLTVVMEPQSPPQPYEPEMVPIEGGCYDRKLLDGEIDQDGNENSPDRVCVSDFEIGKHEITFAQWDACIEDGGCIHRPDDDWGRGNMPVVDVSWKQVQQYIQWLNIRTGKIYRLPSEAEWEYAARGKTTTPFYTGDCITTKEANYDGASFDYNDCGAKTGDYLARTTLVGSYPENPFDLYDMAGNVWEWVQDCWNKNYEGAPTDGTPWETGDCDKRVLRGGSWIHAPKSLRSAARGRHQKWFRSNYIGFRLARTIEY